MAGNKRDIITKRQPSANEFKVGDKLEVCHAESGSLTFRKYEPLAQTKPMLLFKMLWSHICDRTYIENLTLMTETECLASAGNGGINPQDFIADIWANIKQNDTDSDYFTLSKDVDDERTINIIPLYERGHGHASAIGALVCCLNNGATMSDMTDVRLSSLLFSDIID